MQDLFVPLAEVRAYLTVNHSRFITSISPISSAEEFRTVLRAVKQQYPDASHHVSAFLLGHGNSQIAHSHDNGEPSGTAGRPALTVLQGSRLGDIAVVITRYFGGVKLGKGGLVRAYSDAVRVGLRQVVYARKTLSDIITITFSYPLYHSVQTCMRKFGSQTQILSEGHAEQVTWKVQIEAAYVETVQSELKGLSSDRILFDRIQANVITIIPTAEKYKG